MSDKPRVRVIEKDLVVEGVLSNFQAGSGGDLILEFVGGAKIEYHGVPRILIDQCNKLGLVLVGCATLDLDAGTMNIDRRVLKK